MQGEEQAWEAVDRARVLVRREDEEKLRQEALAALEEQSQKGPHTQRWQVPSQWTQWRSWSSQEWQDQ